MLIESFIRNALKHMFYKNVSFSIKVYKAISYKIFRKVFIKFIKYKMCCINIHLTIKHRLHNYAFVTHYQNETLYKRVFFSGTNLTDLLMYSRIFRTHPKFNPLLHR